MSELEPNDSRVVHGNAKPKKGDERFAQEPEEAKQPGTKDRAELDDEKVRNPGQAPSKQDGTREDGRQQEQSRDNERAPEAQFEASQLDRGEAQYQSEPLIQQQHQSDDWSDHNDRGESQLQQPQSQSKQAEGKDFETGQADYGSAQRKAGQGSAGSGKQAGPSDDDIGDAAPPQAKSGKDPRD
jgi:hypothetical protein